jgi:prepilin peptidase CpaA
LGEYRSVSIVHCVAGFVVALELAILCVFPWAMAFGGSMDLFTMTIPNRVSLVMTAGFVVLCPFMGLGTDQILSHFGAGAAMLIAGVVLFAFGLLGGGDAKLFAAGALWVSFDHLLEFIYFMTLFGGILTLLLLWYRSKLLPYFLLKQRWALHLHDPKIGVPYGVAIAAAGLVVYPAMPWAIALSG